MADGFFAPSQPLIRFFPSLAGLLLEKAFRAWRLMMPGEHASYYFYHSIITITSQLIMISADERPAIHTFPLFLKVVTLLSRRSRYFLQRHD